MAVIRRHSTHVLYSSAPDSRSKGDAMQSRRSGRFALLRGSRPLLAVHSGATSADILRATRHQTLVTERWGPPTCLDAISVQLSQACLSNCASQPHLQRNARCIDCGQTAPIKCSGGEPRQTQDDLDPIITSELQVDSAMAACPYLHTCKTSGSSPETQAEHSSGAFRHHTFLSHFASAPST
jgi:hypothetical protein